MKLIESLREQAENLRGSEWHLDVDWQTVLALCDAAEALRGLIKSNMVCAPDRECPYCKPAHAAIAKLAALEKVKP